MINKLSILIGAKYVCLGICQNYLIFIPAKKYIKYFSGTTRIKSWKSNGMLEESFENITKSDSNSALTFVDHHLSPDMNFNGHCLIKSNISICKSIHFLHRFFLSNCLFGSVKLTKNSDIDKYKYIG